MPSAPFVSIAMPSFDEEPYIEACLRSILGQDYPADRMEILVADGGSRDKTRAIVARLAQEDPRIRLLDNSAHRIQSRGMNLCMKASKGELILVTDVHAEYAKDYVSQLVRAFEKSGADCAGGAQRAKAETWFQKALCAALGSPLGAGGAPYRSADREGFVDTVFPGAFRRSILEKVGLFDVDAVTNEDAELQQRILEAGGKVFLSKDVVVHYYPRKSFERLARQYFKYGDGRARTLLLHGRLPVMRPLLPFATVLGGLAVLAVPQLVSFAPLYFGAYAAATGVEALRVGASVGAWAVPVVWAIFPTMHVAHGLGVLTGLVKHTLAPRPPNIERLDPRHEDGTVEAPAFA
jgi:cellulose synthase/poly-beta-1,6-N-acetylglucosamine synthase-like glycosyltransferase